MTTATTGTGTITLGSAVSGFLTFALAGVSNGETVAYGIKDGANSEVGTGTYTSAGTTLTRSVTKSTNSDAAINLSGNAEVYVTARKEDILNDINDLTEDTSPDVEADFIPTYDASAAGHKKVKIQNVSGWTLLTSGTISNSATSLDFVLTNYSEYKFLKFFINFLPATDDTELSIRTSTDGGSTYDSGVNDYSWTIVGNDATTGGGLFDQDVNDTEIELCLNAANQGVGSSSTEGGFTEVTLTDWTDAALFTRVLASTTYVNTDAIVTVCAGNRSTAADVDAIRFKFVSGNFAASNPGNYSVYGLR